MVFANITSSQIFRKWHKLQHSFGKLIYFSIWSILVFGTVSLEHDITESCDCNRCPCLSGTETGCIMGRHREKFQNFLPNYWVGYYWIRSVRELVRSRTHWGILYLTSALQTQQLPKKNKFVCDYPSLVYPFCKIRTTFVYIFNNQFLPGLSGHIPW